MPKKICRALLAVLLMLASIPTLYAVDDVTEEAREEIITQQELFRKKPEEIPVKKEEEPEIAHEEKEEAPPKEKGPVFFVQKVTFEGNQIFSEEELAPYAKPFEGRELSFEEFRKLAELITNHYRSRGFTTSRAYIPPQTVENAAPVIRIVEGKVGETFVEGNRYFNKRLYEKMLKWREDRVFRYEDLETSLYFLNREPDHRAKAYIMAGEKPQTSDVILKAEETFPIHGSYEFSNRGTKFTHRARHTLSITHNNLLGLGDIANGSLALAEEGAFQAASFQYLFPLDRAKSTLRMSASFAKSKLIRELKTFEVEGKSFSIVPGITRHFIKTRKWMVDGNLDFEIKDSKTTIGEPKISFDRVRVLKAGPRIVRQDRWGRTILSGDIHVGIPGILGANDRRDENASRAKAGGQFVYGTASAARIQRLPKSSILILRGSGQFPRNTLPSVEQFRAGGAYSVRGYPEGDGVGDMGYALSSELRIPPLFIPEHWRLPWIHKKIREAVYLIAFIDGGKVYLLKRPSPTSKKNKRLIGTGFGVRVDLDEALALSFDVGFPFGDKSTEENDVLVHLSVKSGF